MRFRITRGGPAAQLRFDRTAKPVVKPQPENPVSLAAALDNPYGLSLIHISEPTRH